MIAVNPVYGEYRRLIRVSCQRLIGTDVKCAVNNYCLGEEGTHGIKLSRGEDAEVHLLWWVPVKSDLSRVG